MKLCETCVLLLRAAASARTLCGVMYFSVELVGSQIDRTISKQRRVDGCALLRAEHNAVAHASPTRDRGSPPRLRPDRKNLAARPLRLPDKGHGLPLPQDLRPRILGPYHQVHPHGHGLNLMLMQSAVTCAQ